MLGHHRCPPRGSQQGVIMLKTKIITLVVAAVAVTGASLLHAQGTFLIS
jgi:hypothetical protein